MPLSQLSPVSTTLLPQTAFVQTLGSPMHDEPDSTRHVLEQPSPLVVLPSSQPSVADGDCTILPSPQSGTHFLPGTRHCQPGSTVWQFALQPSPSAVLPSSHVSADDKEPLPHTAL